MSNKFIPLVRTNCLITADLKNIIPKECPEIPRLLEFVETIPLDVFHVKKTETGRQQYDPRMMLATSIYAFMNRVFSSRDIEMSMRYDDRFKYLGGRCVPDNTTYCRYFQNNGHAISEAMVRFLEMAMEKKVLTGKNFGMDGTKIKANASLTETKTVEEVRAELAAINGDIDACYKLIAEQLVQTAQIDDLLGGVTADDDADALGFLYNELIPLLQSKIAQEQALQPTETAEVAASDVMDSTLPDEQRSEPTSASPAMASKSTVAPDGALEPNVKKQLKNLEQLEHRKDKLERALTQADADQADRAEYKYRKQHAAKHLKLRQAQQPESVGSKPTNKTQSTPTASTQTTATKKQRRALSKPDRKIIASIRANAKATPKQKVNITDPTSKIMKRQGGGYLQGYNLQATTDLGSGIIMHTQVVSDQNDSQVMSKFFTAMDKRKKKPRNLVADKGYDHQYEVEMTELRGINVVTALKRQRKNSPTTAYRERMTKKLEKPLSQELMKARSFVTEGAFAQLKENIGFRQFFRQGLAAINTEIELLALAHNFKRLEILAPT